MIKIHAWGSALTDTPFRQEYGVRYFTSEGVVFTGENDADLIVGGNLKQLLGLMMRHGRGKKYLLWSIEPRWCKHFEPRISSVMLPDFHVMNLYTGIFDNNYLFLPAGSEIPAFNLSGRSREKRIVALMTYQSGPFWKFMHNGTDLDLCNLRTEIALEGHRRGCLDIYGRGWPVNIVVGESRATGWEEKKQDILTRYHFNLCFENTNWPYYCTEKIWQAVQGGCLPVYYGKSNNIYEDFPEESFIDYCHFNDPVALFDHLMAMTSEEFTARRQRCVEAYNRALARKAEIKPYTRMLQKTLLKFQYILSAD